MANSQDFKKAFNSLSHDDEGFIDHEGLQLLLGEFDTNSANRRFAEENNGSYDATEILEFEDGSSLTLANPAQGAFCAFIS